MDFPYLPEGEIEHKASTLLFEYEQRFGIITHPPIPIEEIIEHHLGIAFECIEEEDEDILGYLNIDKKTIFVNEAILPDNEYKAGRYRFTLAHEVAHWILHAPAILMKKSMPSFLDDLEGEANNDVIMCRDSNKKDPVEWQADYGAGAILMPTLLVKEYWKFKTGKQSPLSACRLAASICPSTPLDQNSRLEIWAKDLAQAFNVSTQAMVIRLKTLGLIMEDNHNHNFIV